MSEERHQRRAEGLAEMMMDRAPEWTRPLVRELCFGIHGYEGEEDRRVPFGSDDLARLAVFPNLEWLDLTMTSVRDLSPIVALKSLRHLILDDTLVEDLTPLQHLENLETLSLVGTPLRRLGPLGRLSKLRFLDLWETYDLQTLNGLEGAPSLREINMDSSGVQDISALAHVPALEELNLGLYVSDLSPLRHLPRLQSIEGLNENCRLDTLAGSMVQELGGVVRHDQLPFLPLLPYLQVLNISVEGQPSHKELQALGRLKALRNLKVSFTCQELELAWRYASLRAHGRVQCLHLSDLQFLSGLHELRALSLGHVRIARLSGIAALASLEKLHLPYAGLRDISQLAQLVHLRHLNLKGNPVSDIAPLARLSALESLILAETKVENFAPLQNLRQLQRLDISHTNVCDLTPLAGLVNLQELSIPNRCENLKPLQGLKKLKHLSIGDRWLREEELRQVLETGKAPPPPIRRRL